MNYDIVPIYSSYRGIERSLTVLDFKGKMAKKNLNILINKYLEYISDLLLPSCKENLERIIEYYNILLDNDIPCEIIAYAEFPIKDAYGYKVDILGIDIIRNTYDSLIKENITKKSMQNLLNTNGLCDDANIVSKIISMYNSDNLIWKPCWIYKVIC